MFIEERHQAILDLIKQNGRISISEIQQNFEVSLDSARRDLRILEEKGLLKRTHGGAIPLLQAGFMPPRKRDFDTQEDHRNYRSIAQKAASCIKPGDIVYLTGGFFGFAMLKYLPRDFSYTLVLNSVTLACKLTDWDNVTVYVIGGKMRMNDSAAIADSMAVAFVRNLHFDLSFITGAGLTAQYGLSNSTDEMAAFQRAVIDNTRRSILLMPSEKIGVNAFVKVTELNRFAILITDSEAEEDELALIQETGIEVVLAK